ncbi:DeoR family transcriptional regulator, aga operon transcriptional repressor [Saccharopolyspora antimicrobica]|uniref:DeoR family transcriptional regulator n=1 Tax=Saccharopolyspora antimicrobica TaxID=455193 RepID=A0A1I5C9W7_9PSEU|nr:DeoR/GlpR family DNA-binding transcription regulator [Saccharopolyspora antimicrobica]RKT88923.1 DeoR family transcriptional regulator [Saccharopolyspora antimicrobica]SFN83757.1 DeoR family transcriptional regulator, aga operon transcriptional repressor [Saccharopolyspora antimicrobica]
MDRHARLSALLDLLGERGKVTVEEISTALGASAATVRRDLDHLAEQQLLTRTRGGAVAQNIAYDLPLRYKAARNAREKGRIARAAAAMVAQGSVVGVNGGTTTTEIARALVSRADLADAGERTSLTIVTNALNIANELVVRPQVKIVVTGGVARPQSFELTGPLGTHLLEEITLDVVFLGVDAVDPARGAFAHNEGEASINRLMTERAQRVVVVADGSKLGRTAFAHICPAEAIDMLLTDSAAPAELLERFEAAGVPVKAV